MQEMIIF